MTDDLINKMMAAAKEDGKTAKIRSEKERKAQAAAAIRPRCYWGGKDKKSAACNAPVADDGMLFCSHHHTDAMTCFDAGADIQMLYEGWKPVVLPNKTTTMAPTRPLNAFVKLPEDLTTLLSATGGAAFKKQYVPNLRRAYPTAKCQYCEVNPIDVLTDCSHLSCAACFAESGACALDHTWPGADGPHTIEIGWNTDHSVHTVIHPGTSDAPTLCRSRTPRKGSRSRLVERSRGRSTSNYSRPVSPLPMAARDGDDHTCRETRSPQVKRSASSHEERASKRTRLLPTNYVCVDLTEDACESPTSELARSLARTACIGAADDEMNIDYNSMSTASAATMYEP